MYVELKLVSRLELSSGAVAIDGRVQVVDEREESPVAAEPRMRFDELAQPSDGLLVGAMAAPTSRIVLVQQDDELLWAIERRGMPEVLGQTGISREHRVRVRVLEQVVHGGSGHGLFRNAVTSQDLQAPDAVEIPKLPHAHVRIEPEHEESPNALWGIRVEVSVEERCSVPARKSVPAA